MSSDSTPLDRYELRASLRPQARRLDGHARISFCNRSERPLRELMFHLYANAFANERSVFMREAGANLRGTRLQHRGSIEVSSLRTSSGVELMPGANRELIPEDTTQLSVPLPQPLPPGEVLVLDATFVVQLPSIVARMGAEDDFAMLGQWFPKLAKLEPDGRWVNFPYHGMGEFYADFADYDLRVEVPADYVVAAPGQPLALPHAEAQRAANAGLRVERYQLRHALDIAFAAGPQLQRSTASAQEVQVDVFAPKGHIALAREQAQLVSDGLQTLSRQLGAYPYPRLVLVLPPANALGAAGMEYPGLIVSWPLSSRAPLNPWQSELLGMVTSHELAHQWFAILLASNELEHPLLDEGLAQWTGLQLIRERLGRAFFERLLDVPLDVFELLRLGWPADTPSSLLPAYRYRPAQLGAAIYERPALLLESIARCWGPERLWRTLGAYARSHRFGHPTPDDLWSAFDAGYWPGFSASVLRPALEGQPFANHLEPAPGKSPAALRDLQAARDGTGALPASLELVRANGSRERLAWPAELAVLPLPPGVDAARALRIDPDRHNLLDPDRRDDQRATPGPQPGSTIALRLTALVQALLLLAGL